MEEKNLSAGDAADEWLDPIQRKIMQLYHEYRSRRDVSDLPDPEVALAYIACGFARYVLDQRDEVLR